MDDQQKDQEVFRQNLNEKGNFQTLFQIYLLFTHKGSRPDGKDIQKTLLSKFEKVDIVANVKDSLSTFAIWKYIVEYKDNQRLPRTSIDVRLRKLRWKQYRLDATQSVMGLPGKRRDSRQLQI